MEVRAELSTAYAPRSAGPLGSAVRSFLKFARRVPNRELFRLPTVRGELRAESHNEWTLCLWAWYESRTVSGKTGRLLKARSVQQKISLLKGFLSHRYGFQIAGEAPRLKRMLEAFQQHDPRGAVRRKRRGLRRRHLRKLWQQAPEVRSQAEAALGEWAAVTTAWHVLARGGELAGVERSDLTFHKDRAKRRYAILMLRPLKKRKGGLEPKVPQYILEQPGEEWEPYAALRRLADARMGEGPLFRSARGAAMSTGRVRALIKRYASLLGMDPKEFGAHSARVGGAIDLTATGGASELLLQAKGRWQSDIGRIYARMTRRTQLAASALMHQARGRDLEEILPDFVQPA